MTEFDFCDKSNSPEDVAREWRLAADHAWRHADPLREERENLLTVAVRKAMIATAMIYSRWKNRKAEINAFILRDGIQCGDNFADFWIEAVEKPAWEGSKKLREEFVDRMLGVNDE